MDTTNSTSSLHGVHKGILYYYGKPLAELTPIIPLPAFANEADRKSAEDDPWGLIRFSLGLGRNILVRLEPGDATRYEFLLCPLMGSDGELHSVFVVYRDMASTLIKVDRAWRNPAGYYDMPTGMNAWTRIVLSHFVNVMLNKFYGVEAQ